MLPDIEYKPIMGLRAVDLSANATPEQHALAQRLDLLSERDHWERTARQLFDEVKVGHERLGPAGWMIIREVAEVRKRMKNLHAGISSLGQFLRDGSDNCFQPGSRAEKLQQLTQEIYRAGERLFDATLKPDGS